MSNRFDSSGSFTPLSIKAPTPPTASASVGGYPSSTSQGQQGLENSSSEGSSKKKAKKGDSKESEYEFEGNRMGVSPMKIGLLIGVALIAYGLYNAITPAFYEWSSQKNETREYRRQLRPIDLPGR